MSEEKRRGEEEGEGGPGLAFKVFVDMEEFLDKLKLLHYEESFCKTLGFKPFSRYTRMFFILFLQVFHTVVFLSTLITNDLILWPSYFVFLQHDC